MAADGTAAGQVSARQLRHHYRVEKLCRGAKVYGVIADPVRHSISPAIHNRAFQARRMEAVYLPFLVPPVKTAHRGLQRHHSAQAEGNPISGCGGPAGAADRGGKYGVA
jgi:hypothetical protein